MLLRHPWLAPLVLPSTIAEDDEEEASEAASEDDLTDEIAVNKDVARWVRDAMERKRNGTMGKKAKPALHAAPLDAVPNSSSDAVNTQ